MPWGVFRWWTVAKKKKNWEGALESIEGRLNRWRWLLPCMSFRGRTLVINNLVSYSLWHRLAVVSPLFWWPVPHPHHLPQFRPTVWGEPEGGQEQGTVCSDGEVSEQTEAAALVPATMVSSTGLGRGGPAWMEEFLQTSTLQEGGGPPVETPAWDFSCKCFYIRPDLCWPKHLSFLRGSRNCISLFCRVSSSHTSLLHVGLFVQGGRRGFLSQNLHSWLSI